jgi:hypothetical protein
MKFLVGCDPEVFVKQGGLFRSAFGLIQGDKKNPQKVPLGAVQVDGMALEFNIDPASSEDEFCVNVQSVFDIMRKMVPDYEIVTTPVAHFDPVYMSQQPAAALELGCDPDFNAWTGMVNSRPDGDRPFRTAAGHIHIGWTKNESIDNPMHVEMGRDAVKQMDFYLGLASLMFDEDIERRSMYGKAGCNRPKPYGVEYRTLSNAWLKSEKLMRFVYRNTIAGMQELVNGNALFKKYGDVQDIINTSNKKAAMEILQDAKIEVCYGA